jgi:hypothetical protein
VRRARLALAVPLLAAAAAAETIPFRLAATPDPLRAASLPLDLAPAATVAAGAWRVEAALAYSNLWQGTWEIPAIHQEYGRSGEPVGSDELREIETRYPANDMYRVDIESWRADLLVQRGLAHGLVLTLQVPWVEVGGPHWDGIAEWWHETLSFPNADRDLFPRGETFFYAHAPGSTLELRDELVASGLGDVAFSLAAPLGTLAGAEHRAVLAVEAPTGEEGTLLGSGGWDVGARWFAAWRWRTTSLVAGAGYTRLDRAGGLLGVERDDTWHLVVSLDQDLGKGWGVTGSAAYESSPLASLSSTALGDPAAYLRLGVVAQLARGSWIALDTGQDWYGTGVSPDYAFRLTFGSVLGARP